jgi:adenine phosphoribosyltransferase
MDLEFDLDKYVRKIVGFPKADVLFYDITGILTAPVAFRYCIDKMKEIYAGGGFDVVATLESRGFLFGAPYALEQGLPLVLIRKKGKLPGKTISRSYALEYGTGEIELQVDDVPNGARVLLVDDLVATGGSLVAAKALLTDAGARVRDVFCVIGLPFLRYEEALAGTKVTTLLNYTTQSQA